jgi:hypothetical protein
VWSPVIEDARPEAVYRVMLSAASNVSECDSYSAEVFVSVRTGNVVPSVTMPASSSSMKTYTNWNCIFDNGFGGGT